MLLSSLWQRATTAFSNLGDLIFAPYDFVRISLRRSICLPCRTTVILGSETPRVANAVLTTVFCLLPRFDARHVLTVLKRVTAAFRIVRRDHVRCGDLAMPDIHAHAAVGRNSKEWLPGMDSNHRPDGKQPFTLPLSYPGTRRHPAKRGPNIQQGRAQMKRTSARVNSSAPVCRD